MPILHILNPFTFFERVYQKNHVTKNEKGIFRLYLNIQSEEFISCVIKYCTLLIKDICMNK